MMAEALCANTTAVRFFSARFAVKVVVSGLRLKCPASRRQALGSVRIPEEVIQFWGSAIVSLPTGGRKKKLKLKVATIEAARASRKPQIVAMTRTSRRYAKPIVVALTGMRLLPAHVTSATPARDTTNRIARESNVIEVLLLF